MGLIKPTKQYKPVDLLMDNENNTLLINGTLYEAYQEENVVGNRCVYFTLSKDDFALVSKPEVFRDFLMLHGTDHEARYVPADNVYKSDTQVVLDVKEPWISTVIGCEA